MSKFTQGKWEYGMHSIKAVTPEETIGIAFVYKANSQEETEANARLIASAPQMYELLKENYAHEAKVRAVLDSIDGKETTNE